MTSGSDCMSRFHPRHVRLRGSARPVERHATVPPTPRVFLSSPPSQRAAPTSGTPFFLLYLRRGDARQSSFPNPT